jgi:hypothetical protein
MEGMYLGYYVLEIFKFQSRRCVLLKIIRWATSAFCFVSQQAKERTHRYLLLVLIAQPCLTVYLDVCRLKFLMWGSLSCYCPPAIVSPASLQHMHVGFHVEKKTSDWLLTAW